MIPWAHPSPQPKQHLDRFSRFCTGDSRRVSLYFTMGWPFLPQNCPFPWGIWTPWFPGPTRVVNPNGISIGAAIFAGLTSVTDRPTDHATRSITTGRIYVRSTAMRPNNLKYVWIILLKKRLLWISQGKVVTVKRWGVWGSFLPTVLRYRLTYLMK